MTQKESQMNDELYKIRHSMAHIMAAAVQKLYPEVKLAFGPPTDNGFYYDFDFGNQVLENKDLKKVEKEMHSLLKRKHEFLKEETDFTASMETLERLSQPYKKMQLSKLHEEGVNHFSFYKTGDFIDLCEGPHVPSTENLSQVAFKLDRISGAYWLGSEKNKMLTRIYALCYQSEEDLLAFIEKRKKAEEFDHKKLGKELDLFFVDETIGKGLILWTPNGTILRDQIEKYAKEMEAKNGYMRVATPHIAKEQLFLKSGHLPAYKESMFPPMTVTEDGDVKETFYLKPMNCPFHHIIYASKLRSYRELPLRLAEYGTCYRFEQSGELSGLLRVRCMTMNDAHIYCTEEGLEEEIKSILNMYMEFYKTFGLKDYYYRLSIRGKANAEKFVGDSQPWDRAEKILADVMNSLSIPYRVGEGEAAFYGPKIDIQFKNLMGREETVSTIQVDFQSPPKFDLTYISKSAEHKRPVILHRAPLSTHERFLSFLIEYYGGAFPLWLAPTQVCIIPVAENFKDYCLALEKELKQMDVRVICDLSDDSFNKKIRNHVKLKVPVILIVGNEEASNGTVTVRRYGKEEQQKLPRKEFIAELLEEIKSRARG